jgi:glycosyltransferase involved in cell wall biosynthesis
MKIAAVCCTFHRPKSLGNLIHCFLQQDCPDRELIVLDDAGQYDNQSGDRWRIVSVDRRFATLGEKRNAAVGLVSSDVEALAVWDDDDLYLPWALRASVETLAHAPWSRPSLVLHPKNNGALSQHLTGGLYHGGWAYRRDIFHRVGGYPAMNNGEDQALARRFSDARVNEADPCSRGFQPFYIYCWGRGWHLSAMGTEGYQRLCGLRADKTPLSICPPPIIDPLQPNIRPEISGRLF